MRMKLKRNKKEEKQKMLIGDVILASNKQEIVTFKDELPNLTLADDISVFSCDDIQQCYSTYMNRAKYRTRTYFARLVRQNRCCHGRRLFIFRSYNNNINKSSESDNEMNEMNKFGTVMDLQYRASRNGTSRHKKRFTVLRKPTRISHLSRKKDASDYILKKYDRTQVELRRLALMGDFISFKRPERRCSL